MNINDKKLAKLNTEVKYAVDERRWNRYGRNGEASCNGAARVTRKAYNKAHRKACKLALKTLR
jgi:hypothetical protein